MVGKEEQLKKEPVNLHPVSRFMKDDASDVQEDSATEDKFYSLDELHILDMIEQVSLIGDGTALPSFFQKLLLTFVFPMTLEQRVNLVVYGVFVRRQKK